MKKVMNSACIDCPIIKQIEHSKRILESKSEKTKKRYKLLREKQPKSQKFKIAKTSFELMRGVTVLRRALNDLIHIRFNKDESEIIPKRFADCLSTENLHKAIDCLEKVSNTYNSFEESLAA